ncbi:hypothetical protein K466DRAFT_595192 [Polyporus arcularius HHB13444]|uniref:Uncharacterized protein n=1 Tax=Polyporus arcularius HHB13444 TaxID=1314778 RepID=A0A5C3PRV3_9APHY|nr:hypothetical protein K466DRAFT_595192 [Polyporus arcularius HHB13444]
MVPETLGVFHCPYIRPSLLENCQRYGPDEAEVEHVAALQRQQNTAQTSSEATEALTFYNVAVNTKCGFKHHDGTVCQGRAVLRQLKTVSFNGKNYFVGCDNWQWYHENKGRGHRNMHIPARVLETLVVELFRNGGVLDTPEHHHATAALEGRVCTVIQPPRVGSKGSGKCGYSHSIDGKVIMPKLVKRLCPAKLKIWYPVDRTDRRAIVLLTGVHNHPTPPDSKSTKDGRDRYQRAVAATGVFGATPFKVDRAISTQSHFDGMRPGDFHASLNNRRQKSDIIKKMKKEKMPYGTGIEAVFHHFINEQKKPVQDRYIHDFSVADGRPVIVTFIPSLVERIHTAKATLHDCTYKRVAGSDIIEWETVIWLDDIDMRAYFMAMFHLPVLQDADQVMGLLGVTIARCYISGETRQDYRHVLKSLFDSIERVTGKPVLFKAFSGGKGGLRALLVDGCQAQIDAIGDFLKELNDPAVSGILETDPQKLVEYLIKICGVHFDRNVTKLSHKCSAEAIARVRALPTIRTKEELEAFKTYCERSEEKALRDWYANKKGMPWFWACINRHFSRMADSDWYTTPDNTNINESAHTLTNLFTGIGLSILEAILSAENFDRQQAATVLSIMKSGVRHNSNNTPAKRMKQGIARNTARHAKAVTRAESNSQKKTSRAGKNKILTDGYDSLVSTHDREVALSLSDDSTVCDTTEPGMTQVSGCLPSPAGPSLAPGPRSSQVHTLPGAAFYSNAYPQDSQFCAGVEPGLASAVARSASYPEYSPMSYHTVSSGQPVQQFEEAYQAYGYSDSTRSAPKGSEPPEPDVATAYGYSMLGPLPGGAEGHLYQYSGDVRGWEASRNSDADTVIFPAGFGGGTGGHWGWEQA